MPRTLALQAAAFALLLVATSAHSDCDVSGEVACSGSGTVTVAWTVTTYGNPMPDIPGWAGWDVSRRAVEGCGPWVRLNDEPIPKGSPSVQNVFVTSAPPNETYNYQVHAVDADHNPVNLLCFINTVWDFAVCPEGSAPMTVGKLRDEGGWAMYIEPCAGVCGGGDYITNTHPLADEVRALANTNQVVRLFGVTYCGWEGCELDVQRYELASCGPTPAARVSWGRIKTIYR